ncbi:MAG: CYTH domain-containing protein [Cyanobacteriota bacterium]|nr:CYTH domain-containing protein [Cyanobacteriota bacterium]
MALEIERRFLVVGAGWRSHVRWRRHLRQGYLLTAADGLTLRVRLADAAPGAGEPPEAWLTLKARPQPDDGLTRLEYEYPIPPADAGQLLDLCPDRLIEKWRHGLDLPGGDWVLDVFAGANAPLVVAEVELHHAEAPLSIPPWCGPELTGRHDLSNAALASRPLAQWLAEERRALLGAGAGGDGRID